VEKVLEAFDAAPRAARDAAVRALGKALAGADGAGPQVLALALGALGEGGGSPELAWPALARDLLRLTRMATRFAAAAIERAQVEEVDAALEAVGAELAKERPREAAAWKALPARALAAVACVIRSRKVRTAARARDALTTAAWPLSDVIPEVGHLLDALRIVDGKRLVVLAPDRKRGWSVELEALGSNVELYVLLAAELAGDGLPGRRPAADAVTAIREGKTSNRPRSATLSFELTAEDGTPIHLDGFTDELVEGSGEPILFARDVRPARRVHAVPSFHALRPELRVAELDAKTLNRLQPKARRPAPARRQRAPKGRAGGGT
jgi:hypothetical protein